MNIPYDIRLSSSIGAFSNYVLMYSNVELPGIFSFTFHLRFSKSNCVVGTANYSPQNFHIFFALVSLVVDSDGGFTLPVGMSRRCLRVRLNMASA